MLIVKDLRRQKLEEIIEISYEPTSKMDTNFTVEMILNISLEIAQVSWVSVPQREGWRCFQ